MSSLYFKNRVEKSLKLWLTLPSDPSDVELGAPSAETQSQPVTQLAPRTTMAEVDAKHVTAEVEFIRAPVNIAAYDDIVEENANLADEVQELEAEPMVSSMRQWGRKRRSQSFATDHPFSLSHLNLFLSILRLCVSLLVGCLSSIIESWPLASRDTDD